MVQVHASHHLWQHPQLHRHTVANTKQQEYFMAGNHNKEAINSLRKRWDCQYCKMWVVLVVMVGKGSPTGLCG